MDIHEIQIDDYVIFDGSVYQIEEISKKGWVHLTYNGNRVSLSSDYILDYLKGVPLTPEILEKNGMHLYNRKTNNLMERQNHSDFFQEDEDFSLELSLDYDDKIRWSINGDEYSILTLDYVHQLQHAIRLVGFKKTIVL